MSGGEGGHPGGVNRKWQEKTKRQRTHRRKKKVAPEDGLTEVGEKKKLKPKGQGSEPSGGKGGSKRKGGESVLSMSE